MFLYFSYRRICFINLIFFLLLLKPLSLKIVYADYTDIFFDARFNASPNPVGSGARAMGMGGAFISVADDATAASWNPAGLLQLTKPEISMVGSLFSGKLDYNTAGIQEAYIEDNSSYTKRLNYLSVVIPFILFRRNMVFSINYQHLYEFSKDDIFTYRIINPEENTDISIKSDKRQRGSLNTFSPAFALQINPGFFIGLTTNFWTNDIFNNGWENLNVADGQGKVYGRDIITHAEGYERYDFSGFNMHMGFLYRGYHFFLGEKRKFRIGGVIKTPFNADIQYEQREISYDIYPGNPVLNTHSDPNSFKDLTLKMPISYGLGISLIFSEIFTIAFDIYRTHWDQYLIRHPSGKEYNPINNRDKDVADIKQTTQIRLGGEYRIHDSKKIIPIRGGIFYDPEPAAGRPDNFYGVSFGTGITYNEQFCLDFVYQFRFGEKRNNESIMGESVSSSVTQHYFYASLIYYFKK